MFSKHEARRRDRIMQALNETTSALARAEQRYSLDMQDHELILFYREHVARLQSMLEKS